MANNECPVFPRWWDLVVNFPIDRKVSQDDYINQCAMRVSSALMKAGFNMDDYKEPKTTDGLARGAESLANYLWRKTVAPERHGRNEAHKLRNREGIVF